MLMNFNSGQQAVQLIANVVDAWIYLQVRMPTELRIATQQSDLQKPDPEGLSIVAADGIRAFRWRGPMYGVGFGGVTASEVQIVGK